MLESITIFVCRTYYLYVCADFVKFIGHTQTEVFTPSKHFIISNKRIIFHTQFVDMFIIHLHTKFHIPRHNKY